MATGIIFLPRQAKRVIFRCQQFAVALLLAGFDLGLQQSIEYMALDHGRSAAADDLVALAFDSISMNASHKVGLQVKPGSRHRIMLRAGIAFEALETSRLLPHHAVDDSLLVGVALVRRR